ncbi:DUF3575 domain-containing protein [uncultured Polaribacter sp.]|uniref:DUF3575 domain-containing protein n=1 Tax=uncultured Polaribacter sp. TaxID=174711 RepID=UPI0026161827|nr:DUF3575 domain-containing protein [uncultured Polaribacter sp.]
MKKCTILFLVFFSTLMIAQENQKEEYPQDFNKKHEIKLNAFSLIVFSSLDVSYEKLINKDTSYGVSVFYNFNDIDNDFYFPKKISITPFYRWFFSETRFARGFFVEGFGMLNHYEERNYSFSSSKIESETDFALGVSVGGKFIIKSGFTAEVLLGIGRNMFNNDANSFFDNSIISRGGISLGYRF